MGDQSGLLVAVSPSESGCLMRTELILTSPHEPPADLTHPPPFSEHKGSMPAQPVGNPGEVEQGPVGGIGPLLITGD